jgi:hypothetical protein
MTNIPYIHTYIRNVPTLSIRNYYFFIFQTIFFTEADMWEEHVLSEEVFACLQWLQLLSFLSKVLFLSDSELSTTGDLSPLAALPTTRCIMGLLHEIKKE